MELSPDLDVLRDNWQTFMPIRGARLTPHSAFIESFMLKPFLSPPTHQAQYCVLGIRRERRHRPFFKILKLEEADTAVCWVVRDSCYIFRNICIFATPKSTNAINQGF